MIQVLTSKLAADFSLWLTLTHTTTALDIKFNVMRYTNLLFTYLFTYFGGKLS